MTKRIHRVDLDTRTDFSFHRVWIIFLFAVTPVFISHRFLGVASSVRGRGARRCRLKLGQCSSPTP